MGIVREGLRIWLNSNLQQHFNSINNTTNNIMDLSGRYEKTETSVKTFNGVYILNKDDYINSTLLLPIPTNHSLTVEMKVKLGDSKFINHIQIVIDIDNKRLRVYQAGKKLIDRKESLEELSKFANYFRFGLNFKSDGKLSLYDAKLYERALTDKEIQQNFYASDHIEPKTDWNGQDYYNYWDMNRVELNTVAISKMMKDRGNDVNLSRLKIREMGSVVDVFECDVIEENFSRIYDKINTNFAKKDWGYIAFNNVDANRWEQITQDLLDIFQQQTIKYAGEFYCGEVV